jgi:RHS repeat-associated protein
LGNKQYEITNHLGNVLAVITDRKLPYAPFGTANQAVIHSYYAQLISVTDYTAFGVALEGRTWSDEGYRYGFNGKEKDNENFEGAYDFGARILDVRLGRWLSVDDRFSQFVSNSAYCYAVNSPLYFIDPDGNKVTGATEEDIIMVHLAIISVLSEHTTMANLFQIAEDGLSLKPIDPETFFNEIKKLGPENVDARNVANALYHAIGSNVEYEISFVEDAEDISGLTSDNNYQTGKDLDSKHGGSAFQDGPNKINIVLNEESITRENKDLGNPKTEGYLNSLFTGAIPLDMDLSVVAAVMGAMVVSNDPYIAAQQSSSNAELTNKNKKLHMAVTMIKIENTIARCLNTWETSGFKRFGGKASDKYLKSKEKDKRVREFDYGCSSNPRDIKLSPNPIDYYSKPSDIPKK